MSGEIASNRKDRVARSPASATGRPDQARTLLVRLSPEVYDALAAYGATLKSARGREASGTAEAILARLVGMLQEFLAALGPAVSAQTDQSPAGQEPRKLPAYREAVNEYRRSLILERMRIFGDGRALRASLGMPKSTLLCLKKQLGITSCSAPEPLLPGSAGSEAAEAAGARR
jgi:hypothetical protein